MFNKYLYFVSSLILVCFIILAVSMITYKPEIKMIENKNCNCEQRFNKKYDHIIYENKRLKEKLDDITDDYEECLESIIINKLEIKN